MDELPDHDGSELVSSVLRAVSSALACFDADGLDALAQRCRALEGCENLLSSSAGIGQRWIIEVEMAGLRRILVETKNNLRLLRDLSVCRDEVEYRPATGSLWQAHGHD